MFQISNLSKAYGTQVLFENVTLSINTGERVGLVGRNGTGKTTLFRTILGLEHPDSGVISIPSGSPAWCMPWSGQKAASLLAPADGHGSP